MLNNAVHFLIINKKNEISFTWNTTHATKKLRLKLPTKPKSNEQKAVCATQFSENHCF